MTSNESARTILPTYEPTIKRAAITTFLLTACTAKTKPTETVIPQQTPMATPAIVMPPTEAPPFSLPTPTMQTKDIYYPKVNLTYTKVIIGDLECAIVPPGGTIWRAAYALGDENKMDDVDEIRLHPIINKGQQEMIAFHPKREAFPQPRTFIWPLIHAGSLACRSLPLLER